MNINKKTYYAANILAIFSLSNLPLDAAENASIDYRAAAVKYAIKYVTQDGFQINSDNNELQNAFLSKIPALATNPTFGELFHRAIALTETALNTDRSTLKNDSDAETLSEVLVVNLPNPNQIKALISSSAISPAKSAPVEARKIDIANPEAPISPNDVQPVAVNQTPKKTSDSNKSTKNNGQVAMGPIAVANNTPNEKPEKPEPSVAPVAPVPPVAPAGQVAPKDPKASFSNIQAFFHTGVTLINPYKISKVPANAPTNLSIDPASSTDTKAFVEFMYTNRWAWNDQRVSNVFDGHKDSSGHEDKYDAAGFFGKHKFRDQFDVQARLGYTFNSGSSTNPSSANLNGGTANTLVGSGDFNAEIEVAYPMLFYRSSTNDTRFSLGPVVDYGVVTERAALKTHDRVFLGTQYSTAMTDPFGNADTAEKSRKVLLNLRLGWAEIDTVKYLPNQNIGDNTIESTGNLLPRYIRKATVGIETEMLYPINKSTFVTFDGRVYSGTNPGQWSMQIGITTSLGDLISTFIK